MPLVVSKKPLNAAYHLDLTGSARDRYAEKVRMCDDINPFMLRPGTDTASDVDMFPEICYGDIVNYLVFSANFLTLEQMKAFKSTEAHNYFTSGWVKCLSAKQLQDDKVLLLGEVSSRDCFLTMHKPVQPITKIDSVFFFIDFRKWNHASIFL